MPTQSWNPNAVKKTQSGSGRFFSKRMIVMLAVVGGILFLVFGYIIGMRMVVANFMKHMEQTQSVATVHAADLSWQNEIHAVGTLHAVQGADLAAEVSGIVTRIGFSSGQDVKAGMLLVQLSNDTERAAADQAMSTYKRDVQLIKSNAVSQTDFDSALANMRSTKAALDKKSIRAPFSGRAGIRSVDVGQYVAAGTTMVTLQALDPIYVDFKVAQQDLPQLKVGSKVAVVTDTFPGKTFPGEVVAFNPKVDETTRTIQVRAAVRNPGKLLLPGMFATVRIHSGEPKTVLTLPQTAISFNTFGNTVFVVRKQMVDGKEKLTAEQRFVVTGDTRGDQIAILSGVSKQDVIVGAGGSKLKNGDIVVVNNSVKLPNDPNPTPTEVQ